MRNSNPIYIVENQVYRFEQIIDDCIELFNSHTQTSIMIGSIMEEDIEPYIALGYYEVYTH